MTTPKSVITADHDAVVTEIQIAAPPERVFKALTDERELVRWFTGATCPVKFWKMDARLGGQYSYATERGSVVINNIRDFDCHGEILEFDPPRLLVFTWYGNWHENPALRTVVRWELTPDAAGTRVKVTHSGLAQEEAARKDYSSGWSGVLEKLKQLVE
jgi:uncharacterized protein YndB with AHSA1/START domain